MGTDPELDGFLVRARSRSSASPASLRGHIPTALRLRRSALPLPPLTAAVC